MGGFVRQDLRSEELSRDHEFTEPVDLSQVQTGDIVGVRSAHRSDPKYDHVGIVVVQNEVVSLLHNARHIGRAVIQPLEEAQKYVGHEVLAWIKRVKNFDPSLANHTFLRENRLQDLIP